MFLMNFLFDFGQTEGGFSGDRRTNPPNPPRDERFSSKNWLKLVPNAAVPEPGNPFPAAFNPELAVWQDQGDMDSGTILLPSSPLPDESNVGIRIALDPNAPAIALGPAGAELTLAVCFGKPSQARQRRSSPFEIAPGVVQTTFVFVNQKSNRVDAVAVPMSWFFPLGLVKFRPAGPKHRTHRYEFSVGISVSSGGQIRHFSHDPEMDITT